MTPEEKHGAKSYNERIKLIAATLSNGGLALLGGAAGLIYATGFTDALFVWALIGATLIALSIAVVADLRPEE